MTWSRWSGRREPVDFGAVFAAEVAGQIRARRLAVGHAKPIPDRVPDSLSPGDASAYDLVGLALSGGGIRSASYNLGMLQALAARGVLRCCDYLSTVSGGGYIGSCLTALCSRGWNGASQSFPFAFDGVNERIEVRRLRAHASYLAPQHGLFSIGTWRMVSAFLLGLFVNLAMVFLLLAIVASLAVRAAAVYVAFMRQPFLASLLDWLRVPFEASGRRSEVHLLLLPVMLCLIAWAVAGLYYFFRSAQNWNVQERRRLVTFSAGLLLTCAILLIPWFCSVVFHAVTPVRGVFQLPRGAVPGYVAVLFTTAIPLLKSHAFLQKVRSALGEGLLTIAAAAFMSLFLMGITYVAWYFKDVPETLPLLVVLFMVLGLGVDINRVSMFYFYRDRLSEAFIVRSSRDGARLEVCDELRLADVRGPREAPGGMPGEGPGAPYPLINATVNLPGSHATELRGRLADHFLFSPLYCGSAITGYVETTFMERSRLTLATAMAISGAAANPQLGFKTNRALAFVLAVFNARLGVWAENPGYRPRFPKAGARARFWPYYLLLELFSLADERRAYVDISDGGHTDNLGMTELLRRRCKVIIASDASADPGYHFEDLGNVIRKARIDLGVQIRIDTGPLVPDPKTGRSAAHVVIGEIEYPNGANPIIGTLIYSKAALGKDDPPDLQEFKSGHAAFPNESTFNQFFDEDHFESYRELGYRSGKELAAQATSRSLLSC